MIHILMSQKYVERTAVEIIIFPKNLYIFPLMVLNGYAEAKSLAFVCSYSFKNESTFSSGISQGFSCNPAFVIYRLKEMKSPLATFSAYTLVLFPSLKMVLFTV